MGTITTRERAGIQRHGWISGRPVVSRYGRLPSADAQQMPSLPARGNHSVLTARRSDGRSRQRNGRDLGTRAGGLQLTEGPIREMVDSSAMAEELRTSVVVQRFLDDLRGDSPAAPIVRELLSHAAERLQVLCSSMLSRE